MSEFEKVQCTCAHGYTCRAMKDPNCCAHSCDYNDVVGALNKVTDERDAALAQLVAVKESGGTGQSPCAKFCESVALGKDFHQLREHADKMKVERDEALAQNAELMAMVEALRIAALNAIHRMSGGEAKADLRDAYDATPAQCLRDIQAEAVSDFIEFMHKSKDCQLCEKSLDAASQYAEGVRAGGA